MDDVEHGQGGTHADHYWARVRARVTMLERTVVSVAANAVTKGDVLGTARFAGRQAAKETDRLVALASPVRVHTATIDFELGPDSIAIEASTEGDDELGATMAAFCAVTAAGLTIYDMCKSADRTMSIGSVELIECARR